MKDLGRVVGQASACELALAGSFVVRLAGLKAPRRLKACPTTAGHDFRVSVGFEHVDANFEDQS